MKTKLLILCGVLFSISILINIYFFIGKGITINQDKRVINNNTNHQEQFQGQLLINQWAAQGDKVEWKSCTSENPTSTLETLHPISSFYAKVIFKKYENGKAIWDIFYPNVMYKTNKLQRTK